MKFPISRAAAIRKSRDEGAPIQFSSRKVRLHVDTNTLPLGRGSLITKRDCQDALEAGMKEGELITNVEKCHGRLLAVPRAASSGWVALYSISTN